MPKKKKKTVTIASSPEEGNQIDDKEIRNALSFPGKVEVFFNDPVEDFNEPLPPGPPPEFSGEKYYESKTNLKTDNWKFLHDGSGSDTVMVLPKPPKWKFTYSSPEGTSQQHCPCGEIFAIVDTEAIGVASLRSWEALHRPHLNARPNPTEKVEMQLLREQETMPSTKWYMIRKYSGSRFEQGDIWDTDIVIRCMPSVRVQNNFVVYVQPLGGPEEFVVWKKVFWNSWRK